ncbi:MAG: MFS transporter [Chloroflexota bacterium]
MKAESLPSKQPFKIFYGWYIVAAGLVLNVYNSGLFAYGFTAFVGPIAATFGWSYAQIMVAGSLRGVESDVLTPVVGAAVDRWPTRRLMLIGITALGLGILWLSQTSTLLTFYAAYLVAGLGGSLAIHMIPTTLIARWFKKNMGKATAVLSLGMGIGGVLVPLITKMIDTYGWQNCLLGVAIGILALGLPLSFVFRTRPEDYGLFPDGASGTQLQAQNLTQGKKADGYTVKEALRTRAFWLIGIASMAQMGTMQAAIYHIMPYLESLGISRVTASMVPMLFTLVSLPSRLIFGWTADILPKRYLAALSVFLTSVAQLILWFIHSDSVGLMILYAVVGGLGIGGLMTLRLALTREYFGTYRFGTVSGLVNVFASTGIIVGPPIVGLVYDTLGNYSSVWIIFSAISMVGVAAFLMLPSALGSGKDKAQ